MTAPTPQQSTPFASERLATLRPYAPPAPAHAIDLHLDANEGPGPSQSVLDAIARAAAGPDTPRRYPDARPLETALADRLGTQPENVLVTNGGDDAIDRACRAVLDPGKSALLHTPTFEMIPRGVTLAGAGAAEIPWREGPFPLDAFLGAIQEADDTPALIALVTPNNPTGCTITTDRILAIADAAPASLVLADLAYVEFADEDPTPALLTRPNILTVRTFSKARSLAGLRVGYAAASEPIIRMLRTAGGPYPVSPLSLAAAMASLDDDRALETTVARVRTERDALTSLLTELGARPIPSQANFVTADFAGSVSGSEAVREMLASRGIAVRGWPSRPDLAGLLRITCPADEPGFGRLTAALTDALSNPTAPQENAR